MSIPIPSGTRLRMFDQALTRQIAFCLRRGLPLHLLAIELTDFTTLATIHGHALTRRMQQRLTQEMDRLKRAEDWQCAWGDGRMVFALPDTSARGARYLAQRLAQQLSQHNFRYNGDILRFAVRLGLHTVAPQREAGPRQDSRKLIMRTLHTACHGAATVNLSAAMQQALGQPDAAHDLPIHPGRAEGAPDARQLRALMRRLSEQERLSLVDELLLASTRA